ncbi:uncharacterized protein LOC143212693 [Lasioglossum baleicum]|uniref:uncharacterized protein LOC143212693 n=1 Tax=Lasioglossum baleicum TaxID=434251 RepID=UPI003FCDD99D
MEINKENDLQLTENICKNIELKVHKNLLSTYHELLEQRKTVLKEEQTKMNNINCTVWAVEDQFCNEVWDFYLEHNFNVIFKPYSNTKEIIECHNCKYSTVPYNYVKSINSIEEDKVTELKSEIDNINNERTSIHNEDIEEDIKNATYILDSLKSFSEEILNLIRMVNFLGNSPNICHTVTNKKAKVNKGFKRTTNGENAIATSSNNFAKIDPPKKVENPKSKTYKGFMGAEKYLKNRPIGRNGENAIATCSNNFAKIDPPKKVENQKLKAYKGFKGAEKYLKNRPNGTNEENVATSSNNFAKMNTPKKRPRVISNIRLGKFTLKKQSMVSLKVKK